MITYTSNTDSDIKKLTYLQFKNLVEAVIEKFGWQIRLAYASVSTEGIKVEDFPSSTVEKVDENRVFRMSDAMNLKQLAEG